jgi:hypothetical protein
VWLLLLEVERLSEAETYVLEELCKRERALGELWRLAQDFLCLFRKGHADGLDNWFQAVAKSNLNDLQTFAWSLQRDQDALAAAIKLPTLEQWTDRGRRDEDQAREKADVWSRILRVAEKTCPAGHLILAPRCRKSH